MNEDKPEINDPNPRRQKVDEEYIVLEDKDFAKAETMPANNAPKQQMNQQNPQVNTPPQNPYYQQFPPGGYRMPPYNPNAFQRQMPNRKKKFPISLVIIIVIAVIGLFYLVSDSTVPTSSGANLVAEERITSQNSSNKIAVINVDGVILESGGSNMLGMAIPTSYDLLVKGLLQAQYDDNVKAVIISINSPGGGMTASDVLNKHIMDFKKNTNNSKPVIALIRDMAASGGYYIASAADYIVAYPTAITGSIGVIMQGYNFSGLMEKFGVEDATVTSVPDKDRGSPTRKPNPYDKEFFQVMLRKMHKRFVDKVFEGRSSALKTQNMTLTRPEVEKWADGNIVLADDALTLKMIDSIGYEEDAWASAMNLANITDFNVVRYYIPPKKLSLLSLLNMKSEVPELDAQGMSDISNLSQYLNNSSTRVWALWLGGEEVIK